MEPQIEPRGRVAFVSTRWASDPELPAARDLARACRSSLQVLTSVEEVLAPGSPAPILVLKERERPLGDGGRGLHDVDRRLCAALPSPVLLYTGDLALPNTVLAAVSLRTERPSDVDRAVLLWAKALAAWRRSQLHVVHAWSPIGESIITCPIRGGGGRHGARLLVRTRRDRTARLEALLASCDLGADTARTLGHGVPSRVIRVVAARTRADLLVIGHRGGSWLGRLPRQPLDAASSAPTMSVLAIAVETARPDAVPATARAMA